MAGWSIRRKLSLLAIIPMIVLLIGGGLFATSIALDYRRAHQAGGYADALVPALKTAQALGNEFAAPGLLAASPNKDDLPTARNATDAGVNELKPALGDLIDAHGPMSGPATSALSAVNDIASIRTRIDELLKKGATPGNITTQVLNTSTSATSRLDSFIDKLASQISATTPSQGTAKDASVASSLSQLTRYARDEQALFAQVFLGEALVNPDTYADDGVYQAGQNLARERAFSFASTDQRTRITAIEADEFTIQNWRKEFTAKLSTAITTDNSPRVVDRDRAQDWINASNQHIILISDTLDEVASQTQAGAQGAERDALVRAGLVSGAVVLTLLVVSLLLATIARTVTGPLRRLRAGAVDIASVQLPAAVARIEQDGVAADVSLPPVLPADTPAGPETFEVARAVDDLGAEAVRLATAQVRLRRALDEAFVSMSRRSQSMVEKQLAIIDDLESQEQDPDQLRNLFRLDHLAARMRRYNDNLLVLAGSAVRTRATAPVKVAELFRAATSEMEQYERVRLQPVSGASIAGTVAGELVHLLAELLDNAAMYSPPSSPIVLSAAFTADGGLQIEVLDAGVGISPGELDRLNARLTQPEAIDTQVPSRMGLFVVARLARRGGFGVMLQTRSDAAGTVALVRVPATLVVGAPGSTGETPMMPSSVTLRTPASGSARLQAPASFGSPPAAAVPAAAAPAPAAAAAGAAAAAAAGIRTVESAGGAAPALPKRRRGNGTGLPAEASAPPPASDLFTPAVPTGADGESEPAGRNGATAIQPALARRPIPPETTPTGIPSMGLRSGAGAAAGASGAGDPAAGPAMFGGIALPPPAPASPAAVPPPVIPSPAPGSGSLPAAAGSEAGSPLPSRLPQRRSPAPAPDDSDSPGGVITPQNRFAPQPQAPQDPLTTPSGEFRALPNPATSAEALGAGSGAAPAAWDDALPTELAARAAAAAGYTPTDPDAPMIGEGAPLDLDDPTPIFDQISVWFTAEPTGSLPVVQTDDVIDLRAAGPDGELPSDQADGSPDRQAERQPSSRWSSLGDQRWLATNARAAAAPDTEGTTETGLPLRRPGANLLPSASSAAPAAPLGMPPPGARRSTAGAATAPAGAAGSSEPDASGADGDGAGRQPQPEAPVDADLVRGRLGSYQRGLANARKARSQQAPEPVFDPVGASLFTANSDGGDETASTQEQGADQ